MTNRASEVYLLTGATGLLGRYLLARLLSRGAEVVVLVRETPFANGRQRIEQCLEPLERHARLPRPLILAGDLTLPRVGLDEAAVRRLQARPVRVIHSAASIRFVANSTSGEPYATNVNGTRHLLDLVQELSVVDFHHVSTAYVGARLGVEPVPEACVESPEVAGNDYERSKIAAEDLVRTCQWLPSRVIHRPSIIVGDSRTMYTCTYHGFYAPLQIGAQYARSSATALLGGDHFRELLGMQLTDSKNLVPVDWVADAVLSVATAPPTQADQIYHWTNADPVACSDLQGAIVDAIREHSSEEAANDGRINVPLDTSQNVASQNVASPLDARQSNSGFQAAELVERGNQVFREQMKVYESYFGPDPVFARDHAREALQRAEYPVVPSPRVDRELLRRLARYALQQNFGWPRPAIPDLPSGRLFECLSALHSFPTRAAATRVATQPRASLVSVRLLGPWSPETLVYERQETDWFRYAAADPVAVGQEWTLPLEKLVDCVFGKVGAIELIDRGYWLIRGGDRSGWLEMVTEWVKDVSSRMPLLPK